MRVEDTISRNCFVNEVVDTTSAVYYDWNYFVKMTGELGYRIVRLDWATILGFHNSSTCRRIPLSSN
jgi:hypothetical protein